MPLRLPRIRFNEKKCCHKLPVMIFVNDFLQYTSIWISAAMFSAAEKTYKVKL